MFKQRFFTLLSITFLALSTAAWADDDIQVTDEPAPTATPLPAAEKPRVIHRLKPTPTLDADDEALLREIEAEKAATATPKTKAPVKLTPTPTEDEEIAAEDVATPTPVAKPIKKVHKMKPTPTPTPAEDENGDYIQEDRTLREEGLGKRLGKLEKPLLNFTLDGVYSRAFDTTVLNSNYTNGLGLDFRIEAQFYRWVALGLYYDLVDFTDPGTLSGAIGIFGRVIPVKEGALDFYAIGGLGLNSLVHASRPSYPGNFQGFAGLGLHTSFTDSWGLDGNVVYTYYSPEGNSLNTVSVKAGLTYAVDLQAFLASLTSPPKVKPIKVEPKEPE